MYELNATHDPALKSWLDCANRPDTDFPIQNLPFGVFRRREAGERFRGGIALGDQVVDLGAGQLRSLCSGAVAEALQACGEPTLNTFFALGRSSWSAVDDPA